MIVIVSVSVCGTILFLLNIVLISCFVHKKRQKEKKQMKQAKGPGMSEGKTSKDFHPNLTLGAGHLTLFQGSLGPRPYVVKIFMSVIH
jgi:hypothetical protein